MSLVAIVLLACCRPRESYVSVPIKPYGVGVSYKYATATYATMSTDRGGNQIRYVFDWGDGEFDTTGLHNSGDTACVEHTWLSEGTFKVRALATNSKGRSSPHWSDELTVIIGANSRREDVPKSVE